MAFVSNTTGNSNSAEWRADGFINLYLPSEDGSRVKIGAIPLRASDEAQLQLLEYLRSDATAIEEVLGLLVADFREAKASGSGKKLALGTKGTTPF